MGMSNPAVEHYRLGRRILAAATDDLVRDDDTIDDEALSDGQLSGIIVAVAHLLAASVSPVVASLAAAADEAEHRQAVANLGYDEFGPVPPSSTDPDPGIEL